MVEATSYILAPSLESLKRWLSEKYGERKTFSPSLISLEINLLDEEPILKYYIPIITMELDSSFQEQVNGTVASSLELTPDWFGDANVVNALINRLP